MLEMLWMCWSQQLAAPLSCTNTSTLMYLLLNTNACLQPWCWT